MIYAAPYDELAKKIQNTVGFATATQMLNHLNRDVLFEISSMIKRLLRPGGYFLAQMYLRQLFDGLDSRTSPFFSLRYSDGFWENVVNSPMMSYNRLKTRDYCEVIEMAGLEVVNADVEPGTPADFALLERACVHPMFKRYTTEELAARYLFIVARKPS